MANVGKNISAAEKTEIIEEIDPKVYFETLKGRVKTMNDSTLKQAYENALVLYGKADFFNQHITKKKLLFNVECMELEKKVLAVGVDKYVHKDDIKYYLDKVSRKVVMCVELSNYEREIPDDVMKVYDKVKDIFDDFYVVFTDYTENHRKTAKIERDPILFGSFRNKQHRLTHDRFYFIADWVDEYCDLTLDRMLVEMKEKTGNDILHMVTIPANIDEMRSKIEMFDAKQMKEDLTRKKPKGFGKITTFISNFCKRGATW
ncbi:hypothetical protein HNP86_002023 [Methanococcus maripaludis]|uniref:Uncharacterized protein n=1 Tax=Methanococcus maripaludis TaxID=39152 RepID=A0A7J9NX90_METMI|nr:hypothetical protein [Methanococcus maripaludis]MBA2851864.1 hypothetical protein [Methanococcus maripaludis]